MAAGLPAPVVHDGSVFCAGDDAAVSVSPISPGPQHRATETRGAAGPHTSGMYTALLLYNSEFLVSLFFLAQLPCSSI